MVYSKTYLVFRRVYVKFIGVKLSLVNTCGVFSQLMSIPLIYLLMSLDVKFPDVNSLDVLSVDVNILVFNSLDVNSLDVNSLDVNSLDVNSLNVNSLDVNSLDVIPSMSIP